MAKYLNLAGLQTLWAKLKDTFSLKSHNHNASDINAGTLPIARGGTGATTWQNANEAILGGTAEEASDFGDDSQIICRYVNATSNKQRTYYRKTSRIWNYIKSKLGISSAVGSTTNPVYFDSNGKAVAVGGTMLKQGSFIDTHSEGSRTIWIDGTNELFAFYDRGGTCTAYEYDLEWNSSSPAPAGTFSPTDLSSHKTTASVANISANVFNSLTGYNQSTVYSGTKYAVYDLKLPTSFSHGTTFYWSFGASSWKPHYFEVLVWKDNATQYPNGYISRYRSTSVGAYGAVSVSVGATEGNSFTHIRIVMDKYSRLAAFGIVNYSSTGLATNYMSRTVDKGLYRSISVAKNNTYNLGSSSAKWANIYATNFNGALKGNADTASNCNYSGKADEKTLVVKRTNAAGGAFIQYLPNNQTENWWITGSSQDSSKFVFNHNGTDKAFIDTNGVYNGDVKGNATTSNTSDYVKILHGNEVNFKNVPTSGNKQNLWFNYRNGDTDSGDSGNKISHYYFGNRDASTDGVSLHADTFDGNATSATTAKKSNNSNWARWDASDSSSGGSYELSSDVLDNYSNINLINGNSQPESPYIVNSSRCENSKVYRFALWSGGIIRFKNTRGAGNVIYFRLDGSTGTINNGEYVDASAREGSIVTVFYSGNVVFIFTQNNSDSIFDVSNDSPSKIYASWSKNGCSKVSRTGGSTYQNSKYLGAMYTDSRSRINIGYVDVNNVEVGNSYKWNGFTMSLGADVDSSTGGTIFFV